MIRMPESFSGFASHEAERLFKASIAHVGAHMLFSERFDLRSLKPLQVAIISLIEDARVEQLAMRGLPGLFRLWAPFHLADFGRVFVRPTATGPAFSKPHRSQFRRQ